MKKEFDMFERDLIISGLRRQVEMIDDLLGYLEEKPVLDDHDQYLYHERTQRIGKNMKKLRKLKRDFIENLAETNLGLR